MKTLFLLLTILAVIALAACGGASHTAASQPLSTPSSTSYTITLQGSIFPTLQGRSVPLAVKVTPFDQANPVTVDWSVQEGSAGGTIVSNGPQPTAGVFAATYQAPGSGGTYHVIATIHQSPTQSLAIPLVVTSGPAPQYVNANIGGFCGTADMRQITQALLGATVQMDDGTQSQDVTWSIQEGAAGGTIASAGVGTSGQPLYSYTAGTTLGTFHLIAASKADPTVTGTVTVTVIPLALDVNPTADRLPPSGSRTIYVRLAAPPSTDLGNGVMSSPCMGSNAVPAVTVGIAEGAAGGTVTPSMTPVTGNTPLLFSYSAPAQTGTYHLAATARDLPSVSVPLTISVGTSGYFTSSGPFSSAGNFGSAMAVGLNDGTVLAAGGGAGCASSYCTNTALAMAGLFHPAPDGSVTFAKLPDMNVARSGAGAVLLGDGRVVIAGGGMPGGSALSDTTQAELFDPASAAFTLTGSMHRHRNNEFAFRLPGGRAIFAGLEPQYADGSFHASAEIYDPKSGTFGDPIELPHPQFSGSAMLSSGKILLIGGAGMSGGPTSTVEIFDPVTGATTAAGSLTLARFGECTAVLPDGTVLIAGGQTSSSASGVTARAEVFDPATNSVTQVADMTATRSYQACSTMSNGKVLITGGYEGGLNLERSAELYDPATRSFTVTGGREFYWNVAFPSAIPLPSGRVLVTDGYPNQGVDVYHP